MILFMEIFNQIIVINSTPDLSKPMSQLFPRLELTNSQLWPTPKLSELIQDGWRMELLIWILQFLPHPMSTQGNFTSYIA